MADYNSAEAGIDVFEIIDRLPVSSDWKSFLTHHNDAKRLFRVDLSVQDPATLNELIGAIKQNPLVMKRCLDSNNVSGVHVYDNMLAIQLPVEDDWEASIHPKLTILCLSNALITVRTAAQANNSSDTPDELATFSNRPKASGQHRRWLMSEALPIMLKELRLPAFGQHYQDYQTQATENAWGYSHYLAQLCEQGVAWRFQTRVRNWTKEAKLPRGKSFATLTINESPKAIQPTLIGLRDNTQWALQADNVLLIGPSGVGKSHIAAALGLHLIEQGIRVKWPQATALVQLLQQAKRDLDLMGVMSELDKYRVLIIDDIGPDTLMTVAAIDRIIHHATIIEIDAES